MHTRTHSHAHNPNSNLNDDGNFLRLLVCVLGKSNEEGEKSARNTKKIENESQKVAIRNVNIISRRCGLESVIRNGNSSNNNRSRAVEKKLFQHSNVRAKPIKDGTYTHTYKNTWKLGEIKKLSKKNLVKNVGTNKSLSLFRFIFHLLYFFLSLSPSHPHFLLLEFGTISFGNL